MTFASGAQGAMGDSIASRSMPCPIRSHRPPRAEGSKHSLGCQARSARERRSRTVSLRQVIFALTHPVDGPQLFPSEGLLHAEHEVPFGLHSLSIQVEQDVTAAHQLHER